MKKDEVSEIVLRYGAFVSTLIDFFLVAICLFIFIKIMAKLFPPKEEPKIPKKECPKCFSEINEKATKCPFCTSDLLN